jgi:hypothetical protein
MAALKVYNIRDCSLILGGINIEEGLVSFGVEPEGNAFEDEISADGQVTRHATNECRVTCTLILKGSSSENEKLSAIHAADVAVTNGAGVFVLNFSDELGASILVTDQAWIRKMSGKVFGVSPEDTSWEIRAVAHTPLQFVVGGN